MKLGDHKCSKVTEPDFPGKILFGQIGAKRAQNRPKIDFFDVFSELSHYFFLIFCMKLGHHKCSKVTKPDFPGKILFGQIGAKRAQNGPKIDFFDDFCRIESLVFSDFLHEVRAP